MDAIDKLSPAARALVIETAREYMRLAAEARRAEAESSPGLRGLVEAAKSHAALLAQDGIDVADDESGETNYGLLVKLLADPRQDQVTVQFDHVSTSRNEPYLLVDEAPDFYETYAVSVPASVAADWARVARDWATVQAEMKAAFEAARTASGDHETVQNLMSRFEHEDRWRADHEAYVAEEARLDETVGPREWAVTTYEIKINKYQTETRYRIHKKGCASLAQVMDNGPMQPVHVVRQPRNEVFVRKAEALELYGDPKTGICQRCAKGLLGNPVKV